MLGRALAIDDPDIASRLEKRAEPGRVHQPSGVHVDSADMRERAIDHRIFPRMFVRRYSDWWRRCPKKPSLNGQPDVIDGPRPKPGDERQGPVRVRRTRFVRQRLRRSSG
jgi:hypothetical protein